VIGAPISRVIIRASSGRRALKRSMIFASQDRRCSTLVTEYVAKARRAALTARSTSDLEPRLICAKISSVAGLTIPSVDGAAGSTHAPSM
jgi:hypothetical protein